MFYIGWPKRERKKAEDQTRCRRRKKETKEREIITQAKDERGAKTTTREVMMPSRRSVHMCDMNTYR